MSRRLMNDDAAVGERQARRDAQLVGEDGELVGHAVAVGVFADDDLVVALARRLHVVRIIDGDADPQPAALVPGHGDRLAAEVRLAGEELHLEAGRVLIVLHRLFGRQRLLHLGDRRAALHLGRADRTGSWLRRIRTASRPCVARPSPACRSTAARRSGRRRTPSGCRVRPGSESRGCPRCARRAPRRCRRRGPCPACRTQVHGSLPSLLTRYSRTVRSFCCAWCGRRSHPSSRSRRSPCDRVILDRRRDAERAGAVPQELRADQMRRTSVELRKQYEAQCSGMKPLPPAT